MRILCIGDVTGKNGCEFLRKNLRDFKRINNIRFAIVNGENSSDGNGITPRSAQELFDAGADVITTGNHAFRRGEVYDMFDENEFVLRPGNYPASAPGRGCGIYDLGKFRIAVVDLMGVVYMEPLRCPFETADSILKELEKEKIKNIIVEIHAEATAEKKALAYYLDGRVSAVYGTHTHVLTADETILPQGTGYITDIGMSGPQESVIGIKPELSISKMKNKLPVKYVVADGVQMINGVIFDIDESTGKTVSVGRVNIRSDMRE